MKATNQLTNDYMTEYQVCRELWKWDEMAYTSCRKHRHL